MASRGRCPRTRATICVFKGSVKPFGVATKEDPDGFADVLGIGALVIRRLVKRQAA